MSSTPKISPIENNLTVTEGAQYDETVQVNLQEKGTLGRIDIYLLTDSTGSMGDEIDAVKSRAEDIFKALRDKANEVGADLQLGAGNYRDLDFGDSKFTHQRNITGTDSDVIKAIGSWGTKSGSTTAEGQLYALDQLAQPPGGSIGWRSDAKRVVIWFGDAPGHDPIPRGLSELPYDITEGTVTEKLTEQRIFILAINTGHEPDTSSPGLNADPKRYSDGGSYETIKGRSNQATRIAEQTLGKYADSLHEKPVTSTNIADTIIELGKQEVETIRDVRLAADKTIEPFIKSIHPEGGYNDLSAGRAQEIKFDVSFYGLAENGKAKSDPDGVRVAGTLDVTADGIRLGGKAVNITVPDISGTYKIQNTLTDHLLQIERPDLTGGGNNIDHGKDTGASHQHWELVPAGNGSYRIKTNDRNVERYLEVVGQSRSDEAEILTREDSGGEHKKWLLVPVGADSAGVIYKIQNVNSKKVMDVHVDYHKTKEELKNSRSRVFQYDYWGAARDKDGDWRKEHTQHWRLLPV